MFTREIEQSKVLQWALGALVFVYFTIFYSWVRTGFITVQAFDSFWHVCPPWWQTCNSVYFLQSLPFGYSQTFVYMLLFAGLVWAVYLISEKRWRETQLILIVYFLWHFVHVFFLSERLAGNYEYYVVAFGLILLFFPHKEFFLKLSIVMFYVLSTVAKLHPAWIEGGYFAHLRLGLPLFPDWSIPLFTNFVIFMEMIGAWFLLSKHKGLQRTALAFFVVFHLYSGILVEYRYPSTVLPFLLILFGPWYRYQKPPLDKKSVVGWTFMFCVLLIQLFPKTLSGDEKLTLEANRYGLYMFESNHQCISEATFHYSDKEPQNVTQVSATARHRCNPYVYWYRMQQICQRSPEIERISWTFDHSINGDPFLRIVDVPDTCSLQYHPFRHNEWIKTTADNPEVIGYPVKNYYH